MHYLYLAAIGFAIGLVARIIMPGRDPMGIIMTILLGVAGSYIGAYSADYFNIAIQGTWQSFAVSLVGAFILLATYKFIRNV